MRIAVTGRGAREAEKMAVSRFGIDLEALMERAGLAVAKAVEESVSRDSNVLAVSGVGNNGGDAVAAVRNLTRWGFDVAVIKIGTKASPLLERQLGMARQMGIPVVTVRGKDDLGKLERALSEADVVIDGLFGVGIKGGVTGFFADVIRLINESDAFVISVDVPSGLDPTTGQPLGIAVYADITVTLGSPKIGLLTGVGMDHAGRIKIGDIGVPEHIYDEVSEDDKAFINAPEGFLDVFEPRPRDSHKGTFGHVLVVGGSSSFRGAPVFAGLSALRVGAGLVSVAVPFSFDILDPALIYLPLEEREGVVKFTEWRKIASYNADVALLGPGLSQSPRVGALIREVIRHGKFRAVVLDADAINTIGWFKEDLRRFEGIKILTPHPGEMARMTGITVREVQQDRVYWTRRLARELRATVVLKGAGTVISSPEGRAYINLTGNPALAVGGTGDVVAGMIAGFVAQGFDPVTSACAGVYIHGLVADRIARKRSIERLLPQEVVEKIPETMGEIASSLQD